MSKCCTVRCKNQAGGFVIRWDDYPDEPVCDQCARFYSASAHTTTHSNRPEDGAFQVVAR